MPDSTIPDDEQEAMAALHQRDLRNSATPVHKPCVQHVDYLAADEAGVLDETKGAEADSPDLGDADHAVAAAKSEADQREELAELADHHDDDEREPADDVVVNDSDEFVVSPAGNVAPESAVENDVPSNASDALTAQGIGEVEPGVLPDEPVEDDEGPASVDSDTYEGPASVDSDNDDSKDE